MIQLSRYVHPVRLAASRARLAALPPLIIVAALLASQAPAVLAQPCGTPGRDGSGNLTGIVNTYYPGTASAASGATSISVGAPSGAATAIAAGDLLLVIQMQDAAINSTNTSSYGDGVAGDASGSTNRRNSGVYEFVVATGPVAGGAVPILGGGTGTNKGGTLINSYTNADATSTQGQRRFQVIRVPQYASPTLTSGLTALGWTGKVGGVLAIDVDGTLKLGGATVSVDSLGFRGGGWQLLNGGGGATTDYRTLSTQGNNASKGEGIAGTPRFVYDGANVTDNTTEGYPNGSFARGAPGNAGGGGTDGSPADNSNNSGGGGGANGGTGGQGGNTWSSNLAIGGVGGTAFPATETLLAMGGGGGAGTSNNTGPADGAPGGGIIHIRASSISGTDTLSAGGGTGTFSRQDGAGGGGGGGSIYVAVKTGTLTGLTANAQGGTGGSVNWNDNDPHGPGGGGGGGAVFLSTTGATVSVTGGAHGTASPNLAYGSTSGANGISGTVSTPSGPGARPGEICIVSQALVTSFSAVPATPAGAGAGGSGQSAQALGAARAPVLVSWQTSSEVASAGFYLYRLDQPERSVQPRQPRQTSAPAPTPAPAGQGAWVRLNDRILPAAIEAPQGGSYRFLDASAPAGSSRLLYALLEVESSGRQRWHGPYVVTLDNVENIPLNADDSAGAVSSGAGAEAPPAPFERSPLQPRPLQPADTGGAGSLTATAAASSLAQAGQAPAALKLFVRDRGLYAVRAADLALAFGMSQTTAAKLILLHAITLTSHGQAIAYQAVPDGSSLRFLGVPPAGIYSAENVYWLTPGVPGWTMSTVEGGNPPAPDATGQSFAATQHFEQNLFAGIAIAPDPESDYWFWQSLVSGDPTYGRNAFQLMVQGVVPGAGEAALTLHLQGASATGIPGEHHLSVALNGSLLGEVSWQGLSPEDATLTFAQSLLREGENDLVITGLLDSGVPFSYSYSNSFDLAYRRLLTSGGSPLFFTPDSGGALTVGGFATTRIGIYDVTHPTSPNPVEHVTVDSPPGGPSSGYRATFVAAAGHSYLALESSGLLAPRIEPWYPPALPLRAAANGADHLILAPAAFAGAAASLAAYRQSQGLVSQVVTLEQIYNEFNAGLPSPWAIQSFLATAATTWSRRPTSVVLAGNGTYDYKDYLGLGGNLVPPLMVRTDSGLFAADSQFVAFPAGAGMAIGRIPATSAQQLQAIVNKLIAYEAAAPGSWQRQVLMVADAPDEGGQFDWESDLAAGLIPKAFSVTNLRLSQLAPADLHQQLVSLLDGGAFLLNYVGHGALDRFSAQSVFNDTDAAALANGARLPLVITASCIVGRFEVPGFQPLAAALLDNPAGGAAAVWAPSGLSFSSQTSTLDRSLFGRLFTPGNSTLGPAILAGSQAFSAAGGSASTLVLYNLFGDPALRLQKPK